MGGNSVFVWCMSCKRASRRDSWFEYERDGNCPYCGTTEQFHAYPWNKFSKLYGCPRIPEIGQCYEMGSLKIYGKVGS